MASEKGFKAHVDGAHLTLFVPPRNQGPASQLTSLAKPFPITLKTAGKGDAAAQFHLSSRIWKWQEGIEFLGDRDWKFRFYLGDINRTQRVDVETKRAGRGKLRLERPRVPFTLGRLYVEADRETAKGRKISFQGSAAVFLPPHEQATLSLFKSNMGRRVYMAGEEIELRMLGVKLNDAETIEISCLDDDGRGVRKELPVSGKSLRENPIAVGFDTSFLGAGSYRLQARAGRAVSNTLNFDLVENVFSTDYATLSHFKYPDFHGTTSAGFFRMTASRGVNTVIANHDGYGPVFSRRGSSAKEWIQLDPNREVTRRAEEVFLPGEPMTALMDVCAENKLSYLNYAQIVNWCIFGHVDDEAEFRRNGIIRAYQLREFPSFIGMHYTDNDMPCVPGQGLTGGPAWNSDARAGRRRNGFNKNFNAAWKKKGDLPHQPETGPTVSDRELSKVNIDQALNLASSAQFSQNPKAKANIEKRIRSLDRSRAYFRAYHRIWGEQIGRPFNQDMKAMSPQLLTANSVNHQHPEHYFSSFDVAVNSLMTDYG
ncbi:MAG: hypothetical protein QF886_16235, partial [Planctomycetota bacterium]|nr:hypothetical protein [Planctomycetota bacterium]